MLSGPMRPAPALAAEPRSRDAITTGTVLGAYESLKKLTERVFINLSGLGERRRREAKQGYIRHYRLPLYLFVQKTHSINCNSNQNAEFP